MRATFLLAFTTIVAVLLHLGKAEAKADPVACKADLEAVAGARETWFQSESVQAELLKADCEGDDVYCVDANATPVPGEANPGLTPGRTLTIKLIGPTHCADVLSVNTDQVTNNASLFREEPPAPLAKAGAPPALPAAQLLAKTTVKIKAMTVSVTIVVSRVTAPLSVRGVTLVVTPPRYYLDVGLLVAFTPNYQRVTTQRVPGSSEQFIREEKTVHPSAAIALTYFPAGQYSVPRFTRYHGLGIQLGIGGDLSRIDDEFYMGGVWEPVPGAGISAGLALITLEKLQPGYPEGALVKPNDVPKDTFLGPRFYFGFSLNTEVFQTLLKLGEKAVVPN